MFGTWKENRRLLVDIAVIGVPIAVMSYFEFQFLWVASWAGISVFVADILSRFLDRKGERE